MKKLIFLSAIAICTFNGCSDDDIDDMNMNNNNNSNNNNINNNNNNNFTQCSGGTMSVTFRGTNSAPSNFNNTLLNVTQNGLVARRFDLRTIVSNGILILSISNWDWQNPPDEGVKEKTLFYALFWWCRDRVYYN